MSNGFIYVVDAHFIDKIEGKKIPYNIFGHNYTMVQFFKKLNDGKILG
jgi:hypothetical protein